jgi:5-methylcytosine-specific restriction endonuclease McrA
MSEYPDWSSMTRSEIDAHHAAEGYPVIHREHKFKSGPPTKRVYIMQLAHEVRARKHGVVWDMVDLRDVYKKTNGDCGICGEHVPYHLFTVDHIIPISRGGPHLLYNLQPAHKSCNSRKGDR